MTPLGKAMQHFIEQDNTFQLFLFDSCIIWVQKGISRPILITDPEGYEIETLVTWPEDDWVSIDDEHDLHLWRDPYVNNGEYIAYEYSVKNGKTSFNSDIGGFGGDHRTK